VSVNAVKASTLLRWKAGSIKSVVEISFSGREIR
jgi:hypothetical protein